MTIYEFVSSAIAELSSNVNLCIIICIITFLSVLGGMYEDL